MVFVTGASSGIGEACARAFAEQKKDLLLVARRLDRIQALAAALSAEFGVRVEALALDVSDRAAVERFGTQNAELLSQVTVLVNNAGLAKGLALFQHVAPEEWDVMIDTNIKGLLNTTHLVLPYFLRRREGHVINLGSTAGHWTYPKGNVYCATKHAVRALNESMRLDLNGTGIRVTEVSPGMVETEFSEVRLGDKQKAKEIYTGMTPLKARDIAEVVVWCALRPAHVNIQEVIVYPTDQASTAVVHRRV